MYDAPSINLFSAFRTQQPDNEPFCWFPFPYARCQGIGAIVYSSTDGLLRVLNALEESNISKISNFLLFWRDHFQMAPDLHLLLWMLFAAAFARGNDHFVNPPDISSQTGPLSSYPVYAVGDIITVSWVTAADLVDLVINQLNSPLTQIDRTPNSRKWWDC